MTLLVAQILNCEYLWWTFPCWFASFWKLALVWGGVSAVLGIGIGRAIARANQ